jgi:predicted MFS family arabinose efflux permease
MTVETVSERKLLFIIGAVQLVNVLDFMMVMPLGPDLAEGLAIPMSKLGVVGGSYTAAAAVSGMVGALFLDRFDRRKALALALLGLVLGTLAGGFAVGLDSLIAARVLAGAFGGPATALSLAIIADVVPPHRRGRAMGAVMGAFSVASVLGVPAGLELARLGGWQMPFFAVAGLGLVVASCAVALLPPLTSHLGRAEKPTPVSALLKRPAVQLMLGSTSVIMAGNFALIPHLATYWQYHRGYPREGLGLLYLVGGIVTFGTMMISGRLADRMGAFRVATLGTLLFGLTLYFGFIAPLPVPVMLLFVAFMAFGTFRIVPMQALSSRVPEPHERASFMSAQSAVQHLSAAAGALLSTYMLSEGENGMLIGFEHVGLLTLGLALLLPLFLYVVEGLVKKRESLAQPASTGAAQAHAALPAAAEARDRLDAHP